jgi:hypothetical protein
LFGGNTQLVHPLFKFVQVPYFYLCAHRIPGKDGMHHKAMDMGKCYAIGRHIGDVWIIGYYLLAYLWCTLEKIQKILGSNGHWLA